MVAGAPNPIKKLRTNGYIESSVSLRFLERTQALVKHIDKYRTKGLGSMSVILYNLSQVLEGDSVERFGEY